MFAYTDQCELSLKRQKRTNETEPTKYYEEHEEIKVFKECIYRQ